MGFRMMSVFPGGLGGGLAPDFLDVLEEGFKEFFEKEVSNNPLKAEYFQEV